jgi:hypothetical protein
LHFAGERDKNRVAFAGRVEFVARRTEFPAPRLTQIENSVV